LLSRNNGSNNNNNSKMNVNLENLVKRCMLLPTKWKQSNLINRCKH
jgi:hypothetical protein